MNRYLVEHYLRHRLSDMKDAQLEAVRQDVCYVIGQWIERTERQTGEPFVKYLADHLADHVRLAEASAACGDASFRRTVHRKENSRSNSAGQRHDRADGIPG
jgi:hypothetical protein